MPFDASPNAKPLFKERALWTLVLGLFFYLVYGSTNHISFLRAPHPSLFWDWEHAIPFIPEFVVPYMSSIVVFVVAFLLAPTRISIQKLGVRCGLAVTISAIFFLAMPLQFSFARPDVSGWTSVWFDWLSLDQPYNQFPSLHISLGFIAWHVIFLRAINFGFISTTIWFLLIAASTLLVYQHHFIDVIGGFGVVAAVYWLVPQNKPTRMPLNFVTPRHLHMAFRYLAAAVLFTIAAFNAGVWSILLGWIAVSVLLVAGSYVLGFNGFLRKTGTGYTILSWVLFWPYLGGSRLNWKYWRSRVPLCANVAPGLWIGARPGNEDWSELQPHNIQTVIDLAPELSGTTPKAKEHRYLPLLDIAIPAPKALDDIARSIESARSGGNVYIHCALGMSRSVLAACAWLMRNGKTKEQALQIVDKARPERVTRPYMSIALDLYEEYLRNHLVVRSDLHDTGRPS